MANTRNSKTVTLTTTSHRSQEQQTPSSEDTITSSKKKRQGIRTTTTCNKKKAAIRIPQKKEKKDNDGKKEKNKEQHCINQLRYQEKVNASKAIEDEKKRERNRIYQRRYRARVKAAKTIEEEEKRTQRRIYQRRYRASVKAAKEVEQDKKSRYRAHNNKPLVTTSTTTSVSPRTRSRMTLTNLMDIEGSESPAANLGVMQSSSFNTSPALEITNSSTTNLPSLQYATPSSAAPATAYFAASPIVTLMSTVEKPNQEQLRAYEQAVDIAMERIKNEIQVEEESLQQHDEIDNVTRGRNDAAYKAARERDDAAYKAARERDIVLFKDVRERDDAMEKAARERVEKCEKLRKAKISEIYEVKQSLTIARFKAATPSQDKGQTTVFSTSRSTCPEDVTPNTTTRTQDGCRRNLFGETNNTNPTHLLSNAPPSPFNMHPSNYTFSIGMGGTDKKRRQEKKRIKPKTRIPIKGLKKR